MYGCLFDRNLMLFTIQAIKNKITAFLLYRTIGINAGYFSIAIILVNFDFRYIISSLISVIPVFSV